MEALIYLQHKTNSNVDLIPGVITDERMEGRAQVTLVITGIGGSAMDPALKFDNSHHEVKPASEETAVSDDSTIVLTKKTPTAVAFPQFEMAGTPADLDVPAFLRRRVH
jgi:cell division GTPase FtsZ